MKYEGEFANDVAEGTGKKIYTSGKIEEGEFKNWNYVGPASQPSHS